MKKLWVFDFDGTLSEIVPNRAQAAILPDSQMMLKELSARPDTAVAILTSRTLEDIRLRIEIEDIYLGGTSGLFWQDPRQTVIVANPIANDRAVQLRKSILPLLHDILAPFDVDFEDKFVSVTIHHRNLEGKTRLRLVDLLSEFTTMHHLKLFAGSFAHEIPFNPAINKTEGLQSLFRIFPGQFEANVTTFAGDDSNDAEAMNWLLQNGGQAIVVGNRIAVAGAHNVANPQGLIQLIRSKLARSI